MNDLISIILPVYNGEKYLRESIDSILNQTYSNWELIIMDDCSTDNSPQIIKEYLNKDSRIHYYRNDKNLRLPNNLNKGFKLANGSYFTWTSDDNRFKKTALEKMHNALKNNNANFTYASCRVIDSDGNPIEYMMASDEQKKQIIGHNVVGACFMYTRSVYEDIGDYDSSFTLVEDYDYWQRIYAKYGAVVIEEILYEYRWHDGALTSTMKKDIFNKTLENMLLKNRVLFGNVDLESNYFFYQGLYNCNKNRNIKNNPYWLKYHWYSVIYLIIHRIPSKIKRILRQN